MSKDSVVSYTLSVLVCLVWSWCGGCAAARQAGVAHGEANDLIADRAAAAAGTGDKVQAPVSLTQHAGGTAVSVAPQVVVGGAGGVALCLAALVMLVHHRGRALRAVVEAVEQCGTGDLKRTIASRALDMGVGQVLHRQVRRHTRLSATSGSAEGGAL